MIARALIFATAAAIIYGLIINPVRCSHAILPIEQRTRWALDHLSAFESRKVATSNLVRLAAVSGGCETDVDLYLLRAFNFEILGRNEESFREIERGLKVDDRPELHTNRARLLLKMGRFDEAIAEFAIVARFSPKLIQSLDAELQSRIAVEMAKSSTPNRR